MARVLVLGAYGLLGTRLCPALVAAGHQIQRQGRRANAEFPADPTDPVSMDRMLQRAQPDCVVNLIAATNVDQCEQEPQAAFVANVRTVEMAAQALRRYAGGGSLPLVHISTDQVYDGPGPHGEHGAKPCNVYAITKYAGELAAAAVGATVLRANFVGASRCEGRAGLSDFIVQSLCERKPITVFDDVLFSPLHISTLCDVIGRVIERPAPGVFNVGSRDGMSKAQFALRLAEKLGFDPAAMTVGTSRDITFKARRPLDMRVAVSRFEHTFSLPLPPMDVAINLTAKDYPHAAQSQS